MPTYPETEDNHSLRETCSYYWHSLWSLYKGHLKELQEERKGFVFENEVQTQFADIVAHNAKWEKRYQNPNRDVAAEIEEDKDELCNYNRPDITVTFSQIGRSLCLEACSHWIHFLSYTTRNPVFNAASLLLTYMSSHRARRLHRKLTKAITKDWDLGLIWTVSTETGSTEYGKISVTGSFSCWSIAIKENKFPGHNIPRIRFRREETDYRESIENLEERLTLMKRAQQKTAGQQPSAG